MSSSFTTGKNLVSRRHCYLLLAATTLTYLTVTMGGLVCVTESGRGCPDWPGCHGRLVPMMKIDSVIEYTHRLVAAFTSPFIMAAAFVGWRQSRDIRWVSRPPVIAVVFLFVVAGLGATAVLRGLTPFWAAVDLGLALMVLALMVVASIVAFTRYTNPTQADRLFFRGSFAKLSLWTLGAIFAVLVSGVVVDGDSIARCLGWPLSFARGVPVDLHDWLQLSRRLLAAAASILLIVLVWRAWRTQGAHKAVVRGATTVAAIFCAEIAVGVFMLARSSSLLLLGIYVALAAALWASSVALVVLTGLSYSDSSEARLSPQQANAA